METGINLEHFYNRPAGEPKRDFEMVAQTIHDSGFRNLDHSGNYTHSDYIRNFQLIRNRNPPKMQKVKRNAGKFTF